MFAVSGVGWFGLGIVGFILATLALWPARMARQKGPSWLLCFAFQRVLFPTAVIVAHLGRDRRAVSVAYSQ